MDKKCFSDDCRDCHVENVNVCEVIQSIALQEAGLAHILNAEGEKIQKAVADGYSPHDMLCINSSVAEVVGQITRLEIVLTDKLKSALSVHQPVSECGCQGRLKVAAVCEGTHCPIGGASVKIYDDKGCLIAVNSTDCTGVYCICLDCGAYKVVVSYCDVSMCKDIVIDCDHKHIYVTQEFECKTPPVPPVPPEPICRVVTVTGRVYDTCGNNIAGGGVFIDGNLCPVATTNNCGYYSIKLRSCECIRLHAECRGRRGTSTLMYLTCADNYCVNLTVNLVK